MIKTPKIRTAFKTVPLENKEVLRFFLKTGANEVTDMGMYEVGRLSGKFVNLTKATKSNPSKTPAEERFQRSTLKGLNKEEMAIAAKEIDKGYKYDINDPKAYEYWKSISRQQLEGTKPCQASTKRSLSRCTDHYPRRASSSTKLLRPRRSKSQSYRRSTTRTRCMERRTQTRCSATPVGCRGVYSFVTLGNTVKKGTRRCQITSWQWKRDWLKKTHRAKSTYKI